VRVLTFEDTRRQSLDLATSITAQRVDTRVDDGIDEWLAGQSDRKHMIKTVASSSYWQF
jgi:hypothetical protein